MYWITHTYRKLDPGGLRRHQQDRAGKTIFLCGGMVRLQKGRSVSITSDTFDKFRAELQQKFDQGLVEIRIGAVFGPLVDFTAYEMPAVEKSTSEQISFRATESADEKSDFSENLKNVSPQTISEPGILEIPPEVSSPGNGATVSLTEINQMTKSQLIEMLARLTGESTEMFQGLTRKVLLEEVRAYQGAS